MRRTLAWVVAAWLGAHAVLIGAHVLYIFIYSVVISPGLTNEGYVAHAQASGPWFSILFGGPLWFFLGRLLATRVPLRAKSAGITAWALYSATDLTIVLLSSVGITVLFVAQWIASQAIKLGAVTFATSRPVNRA